MTTVPPWKPRAARAAATARSFLALSGGAVIGEGMQGVAFMPPLQCAPGYAGVAYMTGRASPVTKRPATYVSKVTSKAVANVEMDISKRFIDAVDPYARFTAPVVAECPMASTESDPAFATRAAELQAKHWDTLVFSRYRGQSIVHIWEAVEAHALTLTATLEVINALAALVINVATNVNGKAGVLHGDAHAGNVVYDSFTKDAALIDFGFAMPLEAALAKEMTAAEAKAQAAALAASKYDTVPATIDVKQIHNDLILQFFLMPTGTVADQLKAQEPLARWLAAAKDLRRNVAATQQAYMNSAMELQRQIVRVQLDLTARERRASHDMLARLSVGSMSDMYADDDGFDD